MHERERERTPNARGIPIGNLTSQMFANIYMNELDQFIKHVLKIKYYVRYTDDFIIIHQDRDYMKEITASIQNFLSEKLRLALHPEKILIRKFYQGVDFLGYVNFPHHIVLRAKTRKRVIRKIKQKVMDYKQGFVTRKNLDTSLQSYLGVLSHADAYQLTKIIKNNFWFWMTE